MPEKNVVLGGFMGCGKTTLGRALARRLGRPFLDLDDYIRESRGLSIPEIFANHGEAAFRDMEHSAIRELSGVGGLVLALGGGALATPRNVELLRKTGVVLYLNPGFHECYRRIQDSERPLVSQNTRDQLEELFRKRQIVYRRAADAELDTSSPLEFCVDRAVELLKDLL